MENTLAFSLASTIFLILVLEQEVMSKAEMETLGNYSKTTLGTIPLLHPNIGMVSAEPILSIWPLVFEASNTYGE